MSYSENGNGTQTIMPVQPYGGAGGWGGNDFFGGNGAWWLIILLLFFNSGGLFNLLEIGGIHLGHMGTNGDSRITQELHDHVYLESVLVRPIDRFNLFFNT